MKKRFFGVALGLFVSGVVFADQGGVPPLPTLPGSGVVVPGFDASAFPSAPVGALPHVRGGAFDLRFVNVGQLVDLLYGDAMHVPHVISSEVLQDTRLVSFQFDGKSGDLHAFVKVFLDSQGFMVETRDGVDFVSKRPAAERAEPARDTFVYRPRFRSAEYLAKLVQPLFSGRMNAGAAVPMAAAIPTSADAPMSASGVAALAVPMRQPQSGVSVADELVFTGLASEIRDLRKLLPELDRAAGEVVVRGWVYEVADTTSHNSAFSIAAKVLSGTLSLGNGSTDADPTAIRFAGPGLEMAISALNADTRFKQVSDPHVRVLSGGQVRLNVGSKVPTLGAISFQGASGTPVQAVEYQDAGLIFDVTPTVLADRIEVKLSEQMSSFVQTTTGVNNSPTKNTREMSTTVSMHDGEVIVLGGLVQDSDSGTVNSPGWLPKFLDGRSSSKGRTEVLLVLQVQKC